ncbi:hypothetical protein VNO77_26915 [Canavalia gladiata]|uniref:Uncharacterized protein n=1 Tax=Canavalia gladiata TaxID=3824 RepID=A0AAN9KTQ3_CANGL
MSQFIIKRASREVEFTTSCCTSNPLVWLVATPCWLAHSKLRVELWLLSKCIDIMISWFIIKKAPCEAGLPTLCWELSLWLLSECIDIMVHNQEGTLPTLCWELSLWLLSECIDIMVHNQEGTM